MGGQQSSDSEQDTEDRAYTKAQMGFRDPATWNCGVPKQTPEDTLHNCPEFATVNVETRLWGTTLQDKFWRIAEDLRGTNLFMTHARIDE